MAERVKPLIAATRPRARSAATLWLLMAGFAQAALASDLADAAPAAAATEPTIAAAASDAAAGHAAPPPDAPRARWLVGATLSANPEYAGAERSSLKLVPIWAWRWGRYTLSSSRGSGLLAFGTDVAGPGASAELVKTARLKLGVSLRIDSGRKASDSAVLAGLPDVRSSLRGRLAAVYQLGKQWNVAANLSQDLLGRGGGMAAGLDLGWQRRWQPQTEWSAGVGIGLANGQRMQAFFGVPTSASTATRPTYQADGGAQDVHAGMGWVHAVDRRWIVFGNLGVSRLLGDAAASPLTRRAASVGAAAGLAWRCCGV